MRPYYENRSYDNKLPIHTNITKGFSFLAHWHTDIEIIMVLKGQLQVGIDQEEKVLNQGEAAICTSGKIHFYKEICSDSEIILTIFHPRLIGFPDGWPNEQVFSSPFLLNEDPNKACIDALQKVLMSLRDETNRSDEGVKYMVSARLYEIAGILTRSIPLVSVDKEATRSIDISIAHKILRYIDERYMTNLTLEKVADEFNLSASYLSKLIKKTSGRSFLSYLAHRRILRAEYLLKTSDKNVTEIAFESGFESIRTFNRVFREKKSISPSGFRKNNVM